MYLSVMCSDYLTQVQLCAVVTNATYTMPQIKLVKYKHDQGSPLFQFLHAEKRMLIGHFIGQSVDSTLCWASP